MSEPEPKPKPEPDSKLFPKPSVSESKLEPEPDSKPESVLPQSHVELAQLASSQVASVAQYPINSSPLLAMQWQSESEPESELELEPEPEPEQSSPQSQPEPEPEPEFSDLLGLLWVGTWKRRLSEEGELMHSEVDVLQTWPEMQVAPMPGPGRQA
jgi:hypothetical protein